MTMRRTMMLAAIIAAVGLLLAGLPVAETAPTAQAQTVQHQIDWYFNTEPRLHYQGGDVRLNSLNNGWNNDVAWGRLQGGGWNRSDSYYTYASSGDPHSNRAEWLMGSRVGTQQIAVYIPGNSSIRSTATVTYRIYMGSQQYPVIVNQRDYHRGWVNLRNPSGGVRWAANGGEVVIVVDDDDASPHYREGLANSRIGINTVAMRCLDNCTSPTTAPPTTTPESSSTPAPTFLKVKDSIERPSVFRDSSGYGIDSKGLCIVIPIQSNETESAEFQVSPTSARVEVSESALSAEVVGSGKSRMLEVTINRRTTPGTYPVTVTATNGSSSISKIVPIVVEEPKYEIEEEGFWKNKRIIALRDFETLDGEIKDRARGGIVKSDDNLSHCGGSWIAKDAKVWHEDVRVLDNALVKGTAELRNAVELSGNAKVYHNVHVSGNAKVYDNAQVVSWWYRTQIFGNAHVFGNAIVHSNAKVSGNAKVYDNAQVYGNRVTTLVYGRAHVYYKAKVRNGARVFEGARICGSADVSGSARVYGNAEVSNSTILVGGNHDGRRYGREGCPKP